MILSLFLLFIAVSLSVVAAYYSIIGLITIFSAAMIPIIVMASVLEIAKVTTAAWLSQNWKKTNFFLKSYLTFAVFVLMLITSLGIFGFLSKAHIEQTAGVKQSIAKIERIDEQIKYHKEKIDRDRDAIVSSTRDLDLLNEYLAAGKIELVQGLIGVPVDGKYGKNTAMKVEQWREKAESKYDEKRVQGYYDNIAESEKNIRDLSDKKFKLETDFRILEAEFGPIKYIAEVLYKEVNEEIMDDAVRIVILCLIFVFDPLAILLVIASTSSIVYYRKIKKGENLTHLSEKDFEKEEVIPPFGMDMMPKNEHILKKKPHFADKIEKWTDEKLENHERLE